MQHYSELSNCLYNQEINLCAEIFFHCTALEHILKLNNWAVHEMLSQFQQPDRAALTRMVIQHMVFVATDLLETEKSFSISRCTRQLVEHSLQLYNACRITLCLDQR